MKMINIIHIARGLLCIVAAMLGIVSAADVHIWPNVPELTLTSGADLKLNCTADVPVLWNQNKFDRSLTVENNSTIDISQGTVNDSYVSLLSLSRISYLDTGYYYCEELSELSKDIQDQNSAKIYIYVQHDTHLLAIPENLFVLTPNEYDNIILPCRPTSPDITVTLIKDEEDITESVEYDAKIGYVLRSPSVQDSGVFICMAKRNNNTELRELNVLVQIKHTKVDKVVRPYINSSIPHTDPLIIGQNLSLNCSVSMELGSSFTLYWIIPNEQKLQAGHVLVGKENVFNGLKYGVGRSFSSRLLSIQNVTTEDEGDYVCEVKVHSGRTNRTVYKLKAFTPDMTYLSLSVQGDVYEITRMAGFPSVQWIIQVSAFPKPSLLWRDPNGKELGMNPEKVSVENDKSTSKLVIKDLQLYDSGVYELVANNDAYEKKISVTLLVEDKPLVQISNTSNSNIFYEVGKMYSVECYIGGYPLPNVEWAFKKCPDYPKCQESFTQIPRKMYKEIVLKETFLISLVNITAIETGILFCNATNEFGNSNYSSTFFVSDVSNGLAIKGPPIVVEGDDVTIECGASKYHYTPDIKWIYRDLNNKESPMNNDQQVIVTNNKTALSYHSNINIKNIRNSFAGEYLCVVPELYENNSAKILYSVLVKEPQIPVIHELSNSSSWNVKTGKPVQLACYARGMPPPTVTWFKNGHELRLNKNDSRIFLRDKNQTLIILFTALEDEGYYVCNASNKVGSVISTKTLVLTDKPIEHEHFGFIVFCSVITILLGILMICCAIHLKREKKLKKELALAGLLHFENGAVESWNPDLGIEEQAELLPYDKKWEFPRDKLKLGKQLGSGAFGVVFKADAIGIIDKDTTTTVAVKMIKPNTDPSYIKALASELKIMIHLGRHLNVVNLLGAYTGNINKRELMVIVEYCRFGNIHQYMLKQRNCFVDQVTTNGYLDYNIKTISKNPYYENVPNKANLSEKCDDSSTQIGSDGYLVPDEVEPEWRSNYRGDYKNLIVKPSCTNDLICWSFQVARGMEYLASRKILHGDLAARNILLAEENIVKICDFGFAKTMYNSENYKKKSDKDLLPVKWMAIESLRDRVFSTQSDVWAFGIVLWEIFSLAVTPYPNIQKFNDLFNRLVEGYRMEQPKYANSEIYNIMLDCWKMNPMTRPSFTDLAERLGDLLQDSTKSHYMNLNEVYMRMNTEGSISTDYLSLLTAPTYLNCSTVSENNLNSALNSSENSENKDDLELRPMLHNPVECSGFINLTKPSSVSNPNYGVVDKLKKYSYLQSPCPSYDKCNQ